MRWLILGLAVLGQCLGHCQDVAQTQHGPLPGLIAEVISTPERDAPNRRDLDSALIVVREGEKTLARQLLYHRDVLNMLWTDDGAFLVLSTASSGGHSPWHCDTYLFRRADSSFRSIDELTGPIGSPDFRIKGTEIAVRICPSTAHGYDFENLIEKRISFDEICRQVPKMEIGAGNQPEQQRPAQPSSAAAPEGR